MKSHLASAASTSPKRSLERTSVPATAAGADAAILVVDDRPENVELLTRLLRRFGYRDIVGLTDPTAVVAEVGRREPDLIVLDLQMPGLDGFEIMSQLEGSLPAERFLPVLVLTADTTRATRRRALGEGATDFLSKPFDATELAQRVATLLRTRRLHLRQGARNRRLAGQVRQQTEALHSAHRALEAEASERDLAERIWRSVVPAALTPPAGYRAELLSRPARLVGGDFHLASDGWVVVGDVSGKGVPAALLTGMFVAALKLALSAPEPAAALEWALFDELEAAERFASLIAVRLDGDGGVELLNFGHPPALLLRAADGAVEVLPAGAPPIGVVRGAAPELTRLRLRPGDVLWLCSDGLLDAESAPDRRLGVEGLRALLQVGPEAAFPALTRALDTLQVGDDLTFVQLRYLPAVTRL